MYRFRNIDVSDMEPFDRGQSICFSDGFTVVVAANGGRGTIVKNLYQELMIVSPL